MARFESLNHAQGINIAINGFFSDIGGSFGLGVSGGLGTGREVIRIQTDSTVTIGTLTSTGHRVQVSGAVSADTILAPTATFATRCSTAKTNVADTTIIRKKSMWVSATLTPACTSWVTNTYAYLCTLDAHVTVSHSPWNLWAIPDKADTTALAIMGNRKTGEVWAKLTRNGWEYPLAKRPTVSSSLEDKVNYLMAKSDSLEAKLTRTRRDLKKALIRIKKLEGK